MYAMLTGKLPYTAEPFHITTLYNKMKNNDMNPIPDHLSAGKFVHLGHRCCSLKPRLDEQFLCGNCMWQILLARVDGSTNICC